MTTSGNESNEPRVSNNESHTEPRQPTHQGVTTSDEPLYCSVGEPRNKGFMKRVPMGFLDDARRAMTLEQQ